MQRKDLDSILDAALDELDDNDEPSGRIEDEGRYVAAAATAAAAGAGGIGVDVDQTNNDTNSTTTSTPTLGVPYSLDYLSRCEQASRRTSNGINKLFGPEPPPPPSIDFDTAAVSALMNDKSIQNEMEQFQKELDNFDFGGNQDFNELFQRMNQAFPGVDLDLGDEFEFDKAMKNMMRMASNGGVVDGTGASGRDNVKSSSSSTRSNKQSKDTNTATASTATTSNNKSMKSPPQKGNASTKQTPSSKNVKAEPNVDESIHRLLEGINNASSSTTTNNTTAQPPFPLPPGMENIDPSQFEQFSEEIMSTLMNEFEQMGNKQDSNIVVDNVMKQLLDRDIMYEPMKEVCSRFPKYLAEHKETLSPEEYTRYGTQYQYFQRIVHVYETEPNNFDRLMELMQDIQEYGQPPVEIIKELAPELEFDAEGMPIMNPGGGVGEGGMPPFLPGMMGNEQCCIS